MSDLEKLQQAVERAAGKPASHLETVGVVQTIREKAWQGTVEVFSIGNELAYGWTVKTGTQTEYIAMLGKPPIKTAVDAVRAWLSAQDRTQ